MVAYRKRTRWHMVACNGRVSIWHSHTSMDHRRGWMATSKLLLRGWRKRVFSRAQSKPTLVRHIRRASDFAQPFGANSMAQGMGEAICRDWRRALSCIHRALVEIK